MGAANGKAIDGMPLDSVAEEVAKLADVSVRSAYRLLAKHGAPKDPDAGRYAPLNPPLRAAILHDVTTRQLRVEVARKRRPTTHRAAQSAREYARRRVPPVRAEVLTGGALEQAVASVEEAFPRHVVRESVAPDDPRLARRGRP